MLVLSRKLGESIVIGDNIKVSILKVQGNRIQIGVEAPGEIGIRRAELEMTPNQNLADSHMGFQLVPS